MPPSTALLENFQPLRFPMFAAAMYVLLNVFSPGKNALSPTSIFEKGYFGGLPLLPVLFGFGISLSTTMLPSMLVWLHLNYKIEIILFFKITKS